MLDQSSIDVILKTLASLAAGVGAIPAVTKYLDERLKANETVRIESRKLFYKKQRRDASDARWWTRPARRSSFSPTQLTSRTVTVPGRCCEHPSRARWPFVRLVYADAGYQEPRVAPASPIRAETIRKLKGQVGFVVHARRWMVKRFFAWINHNRRLAKNVEVTIASAEASSALLTLSCCSIGWLVNKPFGDGFSERRYVHSTVTGLSDSSGLASDRPAGGQSRAMWVWDRATINDMSLADGISCGRRRWCAMPTWLKWSAARLARWSRCSLSISAFPVAWPTMPHGWRAAMRCLFPRTRDVGKSSAWPARHAMRVAA